MDFGIDDINRPVIMAGHKAIILPRDLDFKDFPTSSTAPPAYGTITHYQNWDIYRAVSSTGGFTYYKQNDKRVYLYGTSAGTNVTRDIVFKTNRNVKHAILSLSGFFDLDCDADQISGGYDISIVKPDDTTLLTLSSKSVGRYSGNRWVTIGLYVWWDGDTCNAARFEADYKYEGAYGDLYISGNTVLSQAITDTDVRLKIRSSLYEGDTENTGYITAYLSATSLG